MLLKLNMMENKTIFLGHLREWEGCGCYARQEENIVELCEIIKDISQDLIFGESIISDMMIGIECGDKEKIGFRGLKSERLSAVTRKSISFFK